MPKTLFIAPTSQSAGLTSICLGLVRALDSVGVRVGFYKPVTQSYDDNHSVDRSIYFIKAKTELLPPPPIPVKHAQNLISKKQLDELMEQIVGAYSELADLYDVVVVEGLAPDHNELYLDALNTAIAKNMDADVILVTSPGQLTPPQLDEHLDLSARQYAAPNDPEVIGCILNKINAPQDDNEFLYQPEARDYTPKTAYNYVSESLLFNDDTFKLIGSVPWRSDLIAPRTVDIATELNTIAINTGDIDLRRVQHISVCARTVPNMVEHLRPGTLIVTPGDREDIVIATAMAALNGVPLAGLLLTGNLQPDPRALKLCQKAFETGLPVLSTHLDTYVTAQLLSQMNHEVPVNDLDRIETVMDLVAHSIDAEWLKAKCALQKAPRLSPPAFRYMLTKRAKEAAKRIVLPEGDEPRTIRAAIICHERGIAKCALVGNPEQIRLVTESLALKLPEDIQIVDPDTVRANYIAAMVERRKHKGLTPQMAEAQLEDNVVLATMMVAEGEMDGLVSGAVHTTANTIRPALQLIKTQPGSKVVSSVFFMCLPEQVLVYGDCAVNPDPNAEELADIAIQSADSALTFGIEPRVAMISYSTGTSGTGADVDKVREATRIALEKRPDLIIDGPLQYDAAAIESVARQKAPNSRVAGKATVFVFPDLNTGNTTYKAVQRSANVISIGPMLQGLKKPVNDLSRGALVEDIVFTIALTAVQAIQSEIQSS
ncbi:MAG: phosphate acetyltransferase [Pseudomonadales bacterium]|uniref:Phosphate acetyltransferase n=1 Tax=Oleiphilus messinensis TaxID=141451 RepID=A0A1Y0I7S5_9GAMM|nr:phosphate acetyltransferase [Oleiphilus messinensis]ARU56552.1 phosphate acetyltransferase [Oleiphilus messinensis]MCG8608978.1 phosphate acetyltransferase [Pseudomonadales bacterium]